MLKQTLKQRKADYSRDRYELEFVNGGLYRRGLTWGQMQALISETLEQVPNATYSWRRH